MDLFAEREKESVMHTFYMANRVRPTVRRAVPDIVVFAACFT